LLACAADNRTVPTDWPPYEAATSTTLTCMPNLDGNIDAAELQAAPGLPVRYLVTAANTEHDVDLAGKVDAEGRRVWDWSMEQPDDRVATIAASVLANKWYAPAFPSGQFVAPMDAAGAMEAVYRHDGEALWLLGIASHTSDAPEGKTLLVYETPIALFRFPLQPGASWTSKATTTQATLMGLPYAGSDTYEVSVDGAGRLELPAFTFTQALRVRTKVTVDPVVGKLTTRRQVSFLFECFGEVARATSRNDEEAADFTKATEVRRLGY